MLFVVEEEPPFCDPEKDCPDSWSTFFVPIPCLLGFASLALLSSSLFDYLKLMSVDHRLDSGVPDQLLQTYQSLWSRLDPHASGYVSLRSFEFLWRLVSLQLRDGPVHAGLTEFCSHLSPQEILNLRYPVVLWPVVRLRKDVTFRVQFMDVCPTCPCVCAWCIGGSDCGICTFCGHENAQVPAEQDQISLGSLS